MAKRQIIIPEYGTGMKKGVLYYRTRIKDANGKLIALYAKTPEELYNRETLVPLPWEQTDNPIPSLSQSRLQRYRPIPVEL